MTAHDPHHPHSRDHLHSHGPHTHHDHHHHSHTRGAAPLGWALALTATFMLVEMSAGVLARSLALLADAGHMLTDAAALALAWTAHRLAARPADRKRTFGYQRLRVLAAFINGCALLFIVAWIAFEAAHRLVQPVPVNARTMIWVGAIGLLVNLAVFAMLKRGDSHDLNIAGATLHVLGDLLGSVAAVIAGVVVFYTGWIRVDPLLSLFVCALIVRSAIALIRRSAHILMEGSPDWLDVVRLRSDLEQNIPAIRDVHHVHAWLAGPQETLLTMHASVAAGSNHAEVLRQAKALLAEQYGITHTTIQIEPEGCIDEDCGEVRGR